jgi:SAM-dependent methyltransferase
LVVDLGAGRADHRRLLRRAGARVVAVDRDESLLATDPAGAVVADATALPLRDGAVNGVFCSNLLEHTPDPLGVLDATARVLRPGGWAWLSWTNWLSPWGGHEIAPFHYLGADRGLAVARRVRGEPRRVLPGRNLFAVHISTVLHHIERDPRLRILAAVPRYYPSQAWILKVPGLREVATWNCLLLLSRTGEATPTRTWFPADGSA